MIITDENKIQRVAAKKADKNNKGPKADKNVEGPKAPKIGGPTAIKPAATPILTKTTAEAATPTPAATPAPAEVMSSPVNTPADTANQPIDFANDYTYNMSLNAGQTAFEAARAAALANQQENQLALEDAQQQRNQNAEGSRRNLAGNFAKRGMMGGQGGAFSRAQDYENAQLVASQTSTKGQIDALNRNFLSQYGTGQGDWTSTNAGIGYKNQAIQQALAAAQARIVGA